MTPGERAAATMKAWMEDESLALAPISVTLMHIVKAIEEAENAALERAARLASEWAGSSPIALETRIRALAHPSPQEDR